MLDTISDSGDQSEKSLKELYKQEITEQNKKWIQDILSHEYLEFKDELMDCTVLSTGIGKTYIVTFHQKNPKNSALSLRKTTQLGKGFGEIGANIKNGMKYDKYDKWFTQFISTDGEEILGGYRFCKLSDSIKNKETSEENEKNKMNDRNQTNSPMGEYFVFDSIWLEQNKEKIIELGTAYTNPNKKNRYAMINNLKALGAIINTYKNEFYLGKMTVPTSEKYSIDAADFMIQYLETFFKPKIQKFSAKDRYHYSIDNRERYNKIFKTNNITGDRKTDNPIIKNILKTKFGEDKVPNMFGVYLGMHEKLEYCGTIKNPDGTLESGIVLSITGLNKEYTSKFITPYIGAQDDYKNINGENHTLREYLASKE